MKADDLEYLLRSARTLVALGTHQEHLGIGGRSWGLGGNNRTEIKQWSLSTSERKCEICNLEYKSNG